MLPIVDAAKIQRHLRDVAGAWRQCAVSAQGVGEHGDDVVALVKHGAARIGDQRTEQGALVTRATREAREVEVGAARDRQELLGLVKPAEIAPAPEAPAADLLAASDPAPVAITA